MPTTPFNTFVANAPSASALTGAELAVVEQAGVSSQTTAGAIANFVSSVSATVAASVNNYAPAGYVGGTTNRLILTPAGGGSTITGLSASGVPDHWTITIYNPSTTDVIYFSNLSASSSAGNKFACPGGVTAVLSPQNAAVLKYVVNQWVFT
jgi:hypothetical protein